VKKLIVAALCAFMATSLLAREAVLKTERKNSCEGCMSEWTPFALTLCGPVGLPWGNWNVKGLQIGLANYTYELSGLQIGVVNITDRAYGFQIGVVNVIASDDVPFLPIVNWSF